MGVFYYLNLVRKKCWQLFNSLPTSVVCHCHLKIFLQPGQARQNLEPDQDTNCLTLMVFLKFFSKNLIFEKNKADDKKRAKLPSRQIVILAHRIRVSDILSWDRKSYLTQAVT